MTTRTDQTSAVHDAKASGARQHWLRGHAPGIAVALLLAAMLVAPRWWLLTTSPPQGERINISPWGASYFGSDEAQYFAIVRQAYDGQFPVREPYLAGHDDAPPQAAAFWQQAVGQFGRVTGGIFSSLAILTTIAMVASLLLLYALCWQVTGSRLAAVALLPIIAMAVTVWNQLDGLRHLDTLKVVLSDDPQRNFHVWTRFISPAMTLPLFLAAVIAVPRAVEEGRPRWIAAASASLALLIYSYIFYWTAMAAALAVVLAWLLWRRDFGSARRLTLIGAVAAAVALPELILLTYDAFASSAEATARTGLQSGIGIERGALSPVALRLIGGAPFLWAIRGPSPRATLYRALYVVPLVMACVKGVIPQPWHYRWGLVFGLPALIAGGAGLVSMLPRPAMRVVPAVLVLGAIAGVAHVAVLQVRAAHSTNAAFAQSDDEHAAFDWIRRHTGRDDTVVSSSITTNQYLTALTPASVYIPDIFTLKLSDDEIVRRYLRVQAAYGYAAATVFARLDPRNGAADHQQPYERHAEDFVAFHLFNWEVQDAPEKIAARMPRWREEYLLMQEEQSVLSAFPATYLYCGHRERYWPAVLPATGTFVTIAFQQGEATLYRLVDREAAGATEFRGCDPP